MMNKPLDEGDLLAYIAGEALSHVSNSIEQSPELQREAVNLKRAETILFKQFGGIERPTTQDMIDVLLEQATQAQIIRVRRYVSQSAKGRATYEQLQHMSQSTDSNESLLESQRFQWIHHVALPRFVSGTRSNTESSPKQSQIRAHPTRPNTELFAVDHLDAQILVQIFPPERGQWIVQGNITQALIPVANIKIVLQDTYNQSTTTSTDDQGMFSFQNLSSGLYQLQTYLDGHLIEVSKIILEGA